MSERQVTVTAIVAVVAVVIFFQMSTVNPSGKENTAPSSPQCAVCPPIAPCPRPEPCPTCPVAVQTPCPTPPGCPTCAPCPATPPGPPSVHLVPPRERDCRQLKCTYSPPRSSYDEAVYQERIAEREKWLNMNPPPVVLPGWQPENTLKIPHFFLFFQARWWCPDGWNRELIGGFGDGPKWMCGIRNVAAPCVVYSFGSNNQFDYEMEIARLTPCIIHTFDPTSEPPPTPIDRLTFHKVGLGAVTNLDPNRGMVVDSLDNWMHNLGHDCIDYLKVDVESSEWALIRSWRDAGKAPCFRHLNLEVHSGDKDKLAELVHILESFDLRLVNTEYNQVSGKPCCMEYTFIRYNPSIGYY